MKRCVVALTAVLVLLVGCGHSSHTSHIDWSALQPGLQTQISQHTDAQDCTWLQAQWDVANKKASAFNDSNEVALEQYLNDRLKEIGC